MTTNARDENWSEWIHNNAGLCPVEPGTHIEYKMNMHGTAFSNNPEHLRWDITGHHWSDIITYRYKIKEPESGIADRDEEECLQLAYERMGDESVKVSVDELREQSKSDGSTASYYELPPGCTELQDLISYRNLNSQDGEIFRAIYRKGRASHSDALRDARKVLFYAKAEVERLERYCIG